MNSEIETKFLDIHKDELRAKLKELGATLIRPEGLMRRKVFDLPNNIKHCYARVRNEGDKITMTFKNVSDENSILGTKEINLIVDDFDNAVMFLENCKFELKAEQETLRELWKLGNVEICIDTWPWIPSFVEFEGPTEAEVWDAVEKAGFDKAQARYAAVDLVYQYYYGVNPDVVNFETPRISFEMEPPEWARR